MKIPGSGRVGSNCFLKFSGRVRVRYFVSLLRVGSNSGRVITRSTPNIRSIHKGIKPFKCNSCEKEFATKGTLVIHISAIHENKKDYKCKSYEKTCDKEFALKANLKRHNTAVHNKKKN